MRIIAIAERKDPRGLEDELRENTVELLEVV